MTAGCDGLRVLITGGAGMIGRKLSARLLADGHLGGRAIAALDLQDIVVAEDGEASGLDVTALTGDLADPGAAEALVARRPDVIFHLAGVVSGEAEANFDLGYRVNLAGTTALFAAIRAAGIHPRVVFASSIAVFGGPFPDVIGDDFQQTPRTSYGTQKLMSELMLNDYSRRGIFDGVALRLPTICVRPGKPNKAASGFFSNIIREPLVGLPAVLPVGDDLVHTHASPRSAVGFMLHAAVMDTAALGDRRAVTLPGVAVSVGQQIAALRHVAGDRAVALIHRQADPAVSAIVATWPQRVAATRAQELGFRAEASFDAIIQAHIADELQGRVPK